MFLLVSIRVQQLIGFILGMLVGLVVVLINIKQMRMEYMKTSTSITMTFLDRDVFCNLPEFKCNTRYVVTRVKPGRHLVYIKESKEDKHGTWVPVSSVVLVEK